MSLAEPSEPEALARAGAWELRVLAGRNTGASVALAAGRWAEVGYAFSNDVVLRDAGARGVRLRLRPGDDAVELEVAEGAAELLGHMVQAPATAILPAYVPLMLGDCAIALGAAGAPRWAEAERLLAAARPPAPGDADASSEPAQTLADLPPWKLISPAAGFLPKLAPVLPVLGGAVAAVAVLLGGWTLVTRWLEATPTPEHAEAALAADGFKGLQVRAADQGLIVDGVLSHGGDLARLQADVGRRRWPATVRVRTNDGLIQNVADMLRTNGYAAEVRALGPGVLSAQVSGGDPARLDLVRRTALHDVAGLRRLAVNGDADRDAGLLVEGDASKRVVSVVGGDDGYVETRDGSRYFVGAMLPDGHTVTAIEGQTVTVLKDGRPTNLKF